MEAGFYDEQELPAQEPGKIGNVVVASSAIAFSTNANIGKKIAFTAEQSTWISGIFKCYTPISGKPGYDNQAGEAGGSIVIYDQSGNVKQTIANGTYHHWAGGGKTVPTFSMNKGDYIVVNAWGGQPETEIWYKGVGAISFTGTKTTVAVQ